MFEEIAARIAEIKRRLSEIDDDIYLANRRLWNIKYDIGKAASRKGGFTTHYRRLLREAKEEEAEEYLKEYIIPIDKLLDDLRLRRADVKERIVARELEKEELEKELERLTRRELIDIDEETGYLIIYDKVEKAYFRELQKNYKEHKDELWKLDVKKYFTTIEIAVNFTFDTGEDVKALAAEIRIHVLVREAGKRLVDAITYKLKLAFEKHVTYNWEGGGAAYPWVVGEQHLIADGIVDVYKIKQIETGEREIFKDVLETVMKVGAYYRISDKPPNMIIEREYAMAKVTGEWSRGAGTDYEKSYSWMFNFGEELKYPLEWNRVRKMWMGEIGWEQLKRIKREEEEG